MEYSHAGINGHDGIYLTMGTCAIYASSTKSKINTVSSTETEYIISHRKATKACMV